MDKPWTNRGTPVYFHGTDVYCRGTAVFCRGLGYPEKREITGPKLWECLFESSRHSQSLGPVISYLKWKKVKKLPSGGAQKKGKINRLP